MKLLIVSNMYPSKEKAYSGIFVKNQYEKIRELVDTDIFAMPRKSTSKAGSITKYTLTFVKFIPYLFRKYDLIHVHYYVPLILLAVIYKAIRINTKIIVTFHGSDILRHLQGSGLLKKLMVFVSKYVDVGIPVGQTINDAVSALLHVKRLEVIPVGVDDSIFFYQNIPKIYDFVFIGSFVERKGIDILIQSISQSSPDIKYCLVGKGVEYEHKLAELARSRGNLEIKVDIGQEEIARIYNQSRFSILPSRSEGFPTVTIESMYCGTPVIGSDIPQIREQIDSGINGYLSVVEDATSLSSVISECQFLESDQYQALVQGSLSSFREISLDKVCSKLNKLYIGAL